MIKCNGQKQCRVCFSQKEDIFVECFMCGLGVHGSCYGCSFTSNSRTSSIWKCRFCHAIATQKVAGYDNAVTKAIKCRICNQCTFGALKSCGKHQGFAHLVCALWTPFICLENSYNMAPIKGIEKCEMYKSALNKLICDICEKSHATIKCRLKCCQKHYHPLCLMETYRHCMMEEDGVIDNNFLCKTYYVYCPDHIKLHQDWDHNEGHKRTKSREVVFDPRRTNSVVAGQRSTDTTDIRMTDNNNACDSDVEIIGGTQNCTKKFRNNEENVNTDNRNVDTFERESNNKSKVTHKQITPKPMSSLPQTLNQSFLDHMYTPSPSIQMDVASQWTERLQNPLISDTDSIFGFGDNVFLREQSPLMMNHEMSPNMFGHNNDTQSMSNYYDPHRKDTMNHNVNNNENAARDLNRNGFNTNRQVPTTPNTQQTIHHSMYLIPKYSASRSLGTPSSNSTFDTVASPHTVASFSSLPTPQNGDTANFKFVHSISGEMQI